MKRVGVWVAVVVAAVAGLALGDPDAVYREAVRMGYNTSGSALAAGKILVGDGDNLAAAVTPSGNATVAQNGAVTVTGASGTFGCVGVATFTAESVHNGGIDADYLTVDAGLGVDTKTAGKLAVGAATATSMELGSAGISTAVLGPLTVLGGTGKGIDTTAAGALYLGQATATGVVLGAADVVTSVGAGGFCAPVVQAVTDATDTRVSTSADCGKMIFLTHADTVAVTLPANGAAAGSWIEYVWAGNDSLAVTISAATADTLVGFNDVDLDSVTFGAGHRIGSAVRFVSDGTYWHVFNLNPAATMTLTD